MIEPNTKVKIIKGVGEGQTGVVSFFIKDINKYMVKLAVDIAVLTVEENLEIWDSDQ